MTHHTDHLLLPCNPDAQSSARATPPHQLYVDGAASSKLRQGTLNLLWDVDGSGFVR